MNALELSNVVSGHGHREVISDVSLAVPEGSVAALVGPNGHGKTTLLWTISGMLAIRAGKISVWGKALSKPDPEDVVRAGVAHVPQGDWLFPQMTIYENLLMGAYTQRDKHKTEARLAEVYALFPKLSDRKDQLASSLSGGERRMVGIGRGMMAGARIIMLDEPSLGLAPIVVDQIYAAITQMKKIGLSIVLVEENPERAADIADYMYVMDNGRIALHGTPNEVLSSESVLKAYFGM